MLQANGAIRVRRIPILKPFWEEKRRYKGLRGGRGSGKSHTVADKYVVEASYSHIRAACIREIQNSIKDSVKQLLEDKIAEHGLERKFKITEREIVCPETDSLFVFRGLQNHTAQSIKSLEGFNRAWYEESQTLSQRSLDLATPTFRTDSEQTFTWNAENEDDPVDVYFEQNRGDPDFLFIEVNWDQNPFFPEELRGDMERDRKRDPDKYHHVWGGKYRKNSEARVFRNVKSFHFETPSDAGFLHGADWGFAIDPTVLIRCFRGDWIDSQAIANSNGMTLFIDREAYEIGCKIEHTPKLFDELDPVVPKIARNYPIRADSARPETIAHMRDHDYPLVVPATKGPGSVVEGVAFLQDLDIIVHPRCAHTWDEFSFYSYKIDKKTNKITKELEDKKNHVIDAVRYAVEEQRRPGFEWYVGS